jgi:hypothetical protein
MSENICGPEVKVWSTFWPLTEPVSGSGSCPGRWEEGPVVARGPELADLEGRLHRQLEGLGRAGGDRDLEGVGEVGDRLVVGVGQQQLDAVLLAGVGRLVAEADHEVVLADGLLLVGGDRVGQRVAAARTTA